MEWTTTSRSSEESAGASARITPLQFHRNRSGSFRLSHQVILPNLAVQAGAWLQLLPNREPMNFTARDFICFAIASWQRRMLSIKVLHRHNINWEDQSEALSRRIKYSSL